MIKLTNNKQNTQINFNGLFLAEGTLAERKSFVDFIKSEVKISEDPYASVDTLEINGSTVVMTHDDCGLTNNSVALKNKIKRSEFLNAKKFFDFSKKKLLPGIISFNPILAYFVQSFNESENNFIFYKRRYLNQNGQLMKFDCEKLDFKRELSLIDAINEIDKLQSNSRYNIKIPLAQYKNIIQHSQNEILKNTRVIGIAGAGCSSIAFNIDNNRVLKLSTKPLYPENPEIFDLPILDKDYIKANNQVLYFCIVPKGLNSNETRISTKDVKDVIGLIKNNNLKPADISSESYDQIAIWNEKPYLCDYECAKLQNGESRLFIAPE